MRKVRCNSCKVINKETRITYDALRDLVPFCATKKHERKPGWSVAFFKLYKWY